MISTSMKGIEMKLKCVRYEVEERIDGEKTTITTTRKMVREGLQQNTALCMCS